MLQVLVDILTANRAVGQLLLWALVSCINLLIAAVGAALSAFLSLLPLMPPAPDAPIASWVGWLNWIFPIGPLIAGLGVCVGLWLVFLVVRIPLRWLKAL